MNKFEEIKEYVKNELEESKRDLYNTNKKIEYIKEMDKTDLLPVYIEHKLTLKEYIKELIITLKELEIWKIV